MPCIEKMAEDGMLFVVMQKTFNLIEYLLTSQMTTFYSQKPGMSCIHFIYIRKLQLELVSHIPSRVWLFFNKLFSDLHRQSYKREHPWTAIYFKVNIKANNGPFTKKRTENAFLLEDFIQYFVRCYAKSALPRLKILGSWFCYLFKLTFQLIFWS